MGLSFLRGNSGYVGADGRTTAGQDGTVGNMNVQKHFLGRQAGNFFPIGASKVLFEDDFESGNLNKWTVINATAGTEQNIWVAGTAVSASGTTSAYISNDGSSHVYSSVGSNDEAWNSHMYFEFTIPAAATGLTLDFDWRCNGEEGSGEDDYDFGYVQFTTDAYVPDVGSEYVGARVGATTNDGKFNDSYDSDADTQWVHETITINSTTDNWCTNCNRRLVFSWTNDLSGEYQPPFAIDNVLLVWE